MIRFEIIVRLNRAKEGDIVGLNYLVKSHVVYLQKSGFACHITNVISNTTT